MIWELIVVGSFWFYMLIIALFVALIISEEVDSPGASFWSVFLFLVVAISLTNFWQYIRNPWDFMFWIVAYLVGACIWMPVKWEFYTSKITNYVSDRIAEGRDKDKAEADTRMRFGLHALPPQALEHKARLIHWAMVWPVNVPWTLLNDPVRAFVTWSYRKMSAYLQARSDIKYRGKIK